MPVHHSIRSAASGINKTRSQSWLCDRTGVFDMESPGYNLPNGSRLLDASEPWTAVSVAVAADVLPRHEPDRDGVLGVFLRAESDDRHGPEACRHGTQHAAPRQSSIYARQFSRGPGGVLSALALPAASLAVQSGGGREFLSDADPRVARGQPEITLGAGGAGGPARAASHDPGSAGWRDDAVSGGHPDARRRGGAGAGGHGPADPRDAGAGDSRGDRGNARGAADRQG